MRLKTSFALKNIISILKILMGPKFTEVKRKIAFDLSRLRIRENYLWLSLFSPCPVNSPGNKVTPLTTKDGLHGSRSS